MFTVGLLLLDDIRAFDFAVAGEVWGMDRSDMGLEPFELRRCGSAAVRMFPGATVVPTHGLDGLLEASLVIVPGREEFAPVPPEVVAVLRAVYAAGTPIAALCSAAFVLAEAGLLDGRRAVTHWQFTDDLAAQYPAVAVCPSALFIEDGGIWTAAGTAGGVDLCLELVRHFQGAATANVIARDMVTAPHRVGDQAQFIHRPLATSPSGISGTLQWAQQHLHRPLTVADLARHARTTPRTFARHFTATTGTTPAQWLTAQRITETRRLLETTGLSIDQIASRCGFSTATMLRRHFARQVGTTPTSYRQAFSR
ncbi:MAG: GlxA family transcriptional regulator [Labedaea sp.]